MVTQNSIEIEPEQPEQQGSFFSQLRRQIFGEKPAQNTELNAVTDRTKLQLQIEQTQQQNPHADLLQEINNGTTPALELISEHEKPKTTYADLKKIIDKDGWLAAIPAAFQLTFSEGNDVQGLHYYMQGVEEVDANDQAGLLRQTQEFQRNQSGQSWQRKLKMSLARFRTEEALYRKGYSKTERLTTSQVVQIQAGDTIASAVQRAGFDANVALAGIREDVIIGPLKWTGNLPEGYFLHLSSRGYPLAVCETPDESVAVPLFVKEMQPERSANPREERIAFLESRLQPGDVLFVNAYDLSPKKRVLATVGRMMQAQTEDEESFYAIHPLVYIGNGKVAHVHGNGGHIDSLQNLLLEKYNAVSVGRLHDPSQQELFAQHAENFTRQTTDYDEKELFTRAHRMLQEKAKGEESVDAINYDRLLSGDREGAVCVDVVTAAAKWTEQQTGQRTELSDTNDALEMFKAVDILYSMNMEEYA